LYRKPFIPAFNALIATARQAGIAIEQGRSALLRTVIPYFQNPFLAWKQLGLNHHPVTSPREMSEPDDMAYDENRYRLPIGVTVFWIVVFFAGMALYTW
jgi:hypothetical protein